jgi:hypothetical protein
MICTPQKYCSGDQITKNEMGRHVAPVEMRRGAYKVLVGKPEGGRPLGTPRHRWEDNIKMNIQELV